MAVDGADSECRPQFSRSSGERIDCNCLVGADTDRPQEMGQQGGLEPPVLSLVGLAHGSLPSATTDLEPGRGNAPRWSAYEAVLILDRPAWSAPDDSNADTTLIRHGSFH